MKLTKNRLEAMAKIIGIKSRRYYGWDKDNKPNSYCRWGIRNDRRGWHETDAHLKLRIIESLKAK